jgi:hypothetical protein
MSLRPHRQPITLYLKLGRRRGRIGNEQTGRVGAETSRACERFNGATRCLFSFGRLLAKSESHRYSSAPCSKCGHRNLRFLPLQQVAGRALFRIGEAWKDRFLGEFQCAQCGALYEVAITRLSAPIYDVLPKSHERVAQHSGPCLHAEIAVRLGCQIARQFPPSPSALAAALQAGLAKAGGKRASSPPTAARNVRRA